MSRRSEQTPHKIGYPNDQQTYEQVFNLISNQRNADKHNNMISLHTYQVIKIIKIDNTKYWWGCGTAGTLIAGGSVNWFNYFGT